MSKLILDIKKPKKCIWYEDGQDCKCPLLDDNDCCRGQGNEANSAANDWDDLLKGCPIKGELVLCKECDYRKPPSDYCEKLQKAYVPDYFYCKYGKRKEKEECSD